MKPDVGAGSTVPSAAVDGQTRQSLDAGEVHAPRLACESARQTPQRREILPSQQPFTGLWPHSPIAATSFGIGLMLCCPRRGGADRLRSPLSAQLIQHEGTTRCSACGERVIRPSQRRPPFKTAGLAMLVICTTLIAAVFPQFRGELSDAQEIFVLAERARLTLNPGAKVSYNGSSSSRRCCSQSPLTRRAT
jgi:hypothetical protein